MWHLIAVIQYFVLALALAAFSVFALRRGRRFELD